MLLVIGDKNLSSWSLRPWLAMKAFEIPFDEKIIFLDQSTTQQEIAKFSPSVRVPCLVDDSTTIWDSLAILETLNEKYPEKQMYPKDPKARAHARSISNEMHSGFANLRQTCPMKVQERYVNFDYSKAQNDINRIQAIWSECLKLSKGPYLFGAFSIADCMYAPIAYRVRAYGITLNAESQKYVSTLLDHAAMKEWENGALKEK